MNRVLKGDKMYAAEAGRGQGRGMDKRENGTLMMGNVHK